MSSEESGDARSRKWAVRVRATEIWASSESGDVEPYNSGEIEMLTEVESDGGEGNESGTIRLPRAETGGDVALSLESDADDAGHVNNSTHLPLITRSENSERDEASAAVEEEKYQCSLLFYLHIMYYMFMWPHDVKTKNRHWILKRFHQIFYCLCSLLSFLLILRITKYYALTFLAGKGELDKFIALACCVVQAIGKVYFIWLYTAHYDKLVLIINRIMQMEYTSDQIRNINKVNRTVGTSLGVAAIFLSLIDCFFWFYTDKWSLENIFRMHAYVLGDFVLAWTPATYGNTTNHIMDTFLDEEITPATWALAIPGVLITFFGHLQDTIMCDVVLLIALSLYQTMINFIDKLRAENDVDGKREDTWRQYELIKFLAQGINDLFGYMLIITHFYIALTTSYFLLEGLKKGRKVRTFLLGITTIKGTLVYLIASKTSKQNKIFKQWVKDLCDLVDGNKLEIGGRKRDKYVLLDDVSENRIGLGTDEFFIDQKFVITFFTAVATFFLMLADFREKEDQE